MDGAKGKPPLSTGRRQVQPISPQLSVARAGADRPRQPRGPSKRARSDDEPDPELGPAQVTCLSFYKPFSTLHAAQMTAQHAPIWQAALVHASEMLHVMTACMSSYTSAPRPQSSTPCTPL